MKPIKIIIINTLLSFTIISATGAWMMNQRTHGEIKWKTLKTENFDIHYYEKIEKIAHQGATIAEQISPVLMEQMGIDELPRLSIAFTEEDEILNGFALPANYTIIWVDQNDAALWSGDEKWLRTVLAHELQHLVYFNTIKGPWWVPRPMDILYSGTPAWVAEGLAEYYTEKWRPFRFDISHKSHVLKNTIHKIKDPHNDGFSKSLYLADKYGDTTITKILNYRNKLGLLNFEDSFKKFVGINLKQFNEDWRVHMNTYYYGNRVQKESISDIGIETKLPGNGIEFFDYFSDSLRLVVIGKVSKGQRRKSIILATRDTLKENKIYKKKLKKSKKKSNKKKIKKPESIWNLKEIDNGIFGELIPNLDISPDDNLIIYPKYHYGENQSLLLDICKYDLKRKKMVFLTNSMRANYPKFSPDGKSILFIAHSNSTTQLFTMKIDGTNKKQITNFEGDVQIITPAWSPDGKRISFSYSNSRGWMDIFIFDLASKEISQITNSIEPDYNPIWVNNGKSLSFTGLYDLTPNLFTYNIDTKKIIQNTDIGDIVLATQWDKRSNTILARTINTVHNSKIVSIKPGRIAKKNKTTLNPVFSSWVQKKPDKQIKKIVYDNPAKILENSSYSFHKNMKHVGTLIFPDFGSLFYNSLYTDALGRHTFSTVLLSDYKKNTSIFFQYQNSTGFLYKGFWGFDYYDNANFNFQLYNKNESLLEFFNGVTLWGKIPYNFGRSLSANHIINYSLQIVNRSIQIVSEEPSNKNFDDPQAGKESSLNLGYLFVNKRSHAKNFYNPDQGYGVNTKIKRTLKYGNFDYMKIDLDLYINKKLGPFSLYTRHRFESIHGNDFPNQEELGIFNISNFYLMGSQTPGREYMSPRGYNGKPRKGKNAYMGSVELRAPVLPLNVVEVLKFINFGRPTVALISDFADAWTLGDKRQKLIIQAGAELRFSILLTTLPVLTFSYGWAQSVEDYRNNVTPNPYFQLTLINPF